MAIIEEKSASKVEYLFNLKLNRYKNSSLPSAFQNQQNSGIKRIRTQFIQDNRTRQIKWKKGLNFIRTNSSCQHKNSLFTAVGINKEEIMSCINKQIKSKNNHQSFDKFFGKKEPIFKNGFSSIVIKKKQQTEFADLSKLAIKMASIKKIEAQQDYEEKNVQERRKKLKYLQRFMIAKFNDKFKKMKPSEETQNQKSILFQINQLRQQKLEEKDAYIKRKNFKSEPKHNPNLKPWEQNEQVYLMHKLKAYKPFLKKEYDGENDFDLILN